LTHKAFFQASADGDELDAEVLARCENWYSTRPRHPSVSSARFAAAGRLPSLTPRSSGAPTAGRTINMSDLLQKLNLRTVLVWLPSCVIFILGLYTQFEAQTFDRMAYLAGGALTVMIGFTSLLYNRSRAWPSGPIQRRALYAAENCFQAANLFIAGCIVSIIVMFVMSSTRPAGLTLLRFIDVMVAMSTPIFFVLWSFYKFAYGMQVGYWRDQTKLTPKQFVRRHR